MRTNVRRSNADSQPRKTGSNRTAVAKRAPDFVQSLDRGLAVIRAFDSEHPRLTLSEVAREAG
ncbi:MAG TPA: helix-turn-helix domain-containing protein, partial [Actinomycetota bacterium]